MNELFFFEFKRLNRSKVTIMAVILTIFIGILGVVLNYVFYKDSGTPKECMISIFNSYTQFTYLILGFLYIQTFAKDYSRGIVNFYNQMGYGLIKQNICKMLALILVTVPAIDFFVIITSFFYHNTDIGFLVLLLAVIDLSTLYVILLAMLISSLSKKVVKAVLIFFGLFMVFNVMNIFLFGLLNPADGNSISTYLLSECAGRELSHYSLDKIQDDIAKYKELLSLIVPGAWCMILCVLNSCILNQSRNKC